MLKLQLNQPMDERSPGRRLDEVLGRIKALTEEGLWLTTPYMQQEMDFRSRIIRMRKLKRRIQILEAYIHL